MKIRPAHFATAALLSLLSLSATAQPSTFTRWSESQANEWYAHQPWLVGANYIPSNAINELEMWQADTFDPPPSTANWAGPKPSA